MKKKVELIAGFTLVELMVVVAIIGILSTVAIPNFKKYQAKAKTSEAKLALASVYTAETSFMGDYDTFATCLQSMGLSAPARGYYSFGFAAANSGANANATMAGADGSCTSPVNAFSPLTTVRVGGTYASTGDLSSAGTTVDASSFIAGAVGKVSSDNASNDVWTIDENKTLQNRHPGI